MVYYTHRQYETRIMSDRLDDALAIMDTAFIETDVWHWCTIWAWPLTMTFTLVVMYIVLTHTLKANIYSTKIFWRGREKIIEHFYTNTWQAWSGKHTLVKLVCVEYSAVNVNSWKYYQLTLIRKKAL